jgi:predicted TIM-barrel fold metal-dependent hydrolase
VDPRRREFLSATSLGLLGLTAEGGARQTAPADAIIDIHQHLNYSGRPDAVFLAHQRAMGATITILLPAGRPANTAATHQGKANGLQAQALGTEACATFARAHPGFVFGANDRPDAADATQEIERYLTRGAILIGEQKFGVACDSPEMQRLYAIAAAHRVPVLMHWQFGMYNHGFDRFHRMLDRYPTVNFIGHAQTWWANIDANHRDQSVLYPRGPVTPGGLTDRYLSDYPNMHGDLSAGSGLNALTRDEGFTREFLSRHQRKLLYGSDCSDHDGGGPKCQGAQTIATLRRLAATPAVLRRLLYENARELFRL